MRRYNFLQKSDVYEALNKVRDALLAANDGNDVEQIMNGVLTFDERMKIGRRIQVAECLIMGLKNEEIQTILKVGKATIAHVSRNLDDYEKCFHLIRARSKKVKEVYKNKSYRMTDGSTKIFKTREYTGFKRKDVER
jgi:Trp operon repressor